MSSEICSQGYKLSSQTIEIPVIETGRRELFVNVKYAMSVPFSGSKMPGILISISTFSKKWVRVKRNTFPKIPKMDKTREMFSVVNGEEME